jgi:hypothetical protein
MADRPAEMSTIYPDMFEMIGSRRVVLPGLRELGGLGWIELVQLPKRHLISRSDRWCTVSTWQQARAISAAARAEHKPPNTAADASRVSRPAAFP